MLYIVLLKISVFSPDEHTYTPHIGLTVQDVVTELEADESSKHCQERDYSNLHVRGPSVWRENHVSIHWPHLAPLNIWYNTSGLGRGLRFCWWNESYRFPQMMLGNRCPQC